MEIIRPESRQPIPPTAKKVFDGVIFDVYQWEQEMYDGSKRMFEKLKRPDTVSVIPVTEEGKIILSYQEQPGSAGSYSTLGGRVDEGEDVLEAAKRELMEESGYEAKEWVLFDAYQPHTKVDWAVYTFVARGCRKVGEQELDGGEKIELKEVSFDEFIRMTTEEKFRLEEIKMKVLEAKLDPAKMDELKKVILGSLV